MRIEIVTEIPDKDRFFGINPKTVELYNHFQTMQVNDVVKIQCDTKEESRATSGYADSAGKQQTKQGRKFGVHIRKLAVYVERLE